MLKQLVLILCFNDSKQFFYVSNNVGTKRGGNSQTYNAKGSLDS